MFQSTRDIDPFLGGHMRRNPKFRLSALFRLVRKDERVKLIGDYPLLAHIINFSKLQNRKFSRNEIRHAVNQSEEFRALNKKEKTELIDDFYLRSQRSTFTSDDGHEIRIKYV